MFDFSWNWHLLSFALPTIGILQYWQLMLPHVALMFGYLSVFQFVTVFCLVSSMTTLLFITYLIAAQVFTFVRGQTRMEYLMVRATFSTREVHVRRFRTFTRTISASGRTSSRRWAAAGR